MASVVWFADHVLASRYTHRLLQLCNSYVYVLDDLATRALVRVRMLQVLLPIFVAVDLVRWKWWNGLLGPLQAKSDSTRHHLLCLDGDLEPV
jgi:hypothetical protein